jgi:hypothetical protein
MAKQITGQVIYLGPQVPHIGLSYGTIFRDGVYPHFYLHFAHCPALAELFVPVPQVAQVRRELNFDLARNMRGTKGRYVTFYREVQKWLADTKQPKTQKPITIKEEHHA